MGVLTMIMMVPLMTMTFIPKDPNGPIAGCFPGFALHTVRDDESGIGGSASGGSGGHIRLADDLHRWPMWMAGKIFRIGILRTGQPPKILEMLRWALRKS